jgi:hypothetical protein
VITIVFKFMKGTLVGLGKKLVLAVRLAVVVEGILSRSKHLLLLDAPR